ncbi:hypothetical protein PFICI_14846 [Pestalotiopsis fici W106-1]|uniref:Uncharacterized protein n=1 Tax=Pestalotiopsis fici (strain W106-1 / CGMCC3.15140) TaxID=1229662 RepID=W3WKC0_PESFW|nr:uncharacterized protein PFICI_14846 [Pestalotiopsis fici W106-1]ETS73241.1 hypothetical protein PFICI_14846 [Pestalotiopsis fici W106-1]
MRLYHTDLLFTNTESNKTDKLKSGPQYPFAHKLARWHLSVHLNRTFLSGLLIFQRQQRQRQQQEQQTQTGSQVEVQAETQAETQPELQAENKKAPP